MWADSSQPTLRVWKATLVSPSAFKALRAFFPRPSSRAVSTTLSPCLANWRAISNPIPLLAPVTTATVSSDHHLNSSTHPNFNVQTPRPSWCFKAHGITESELASYSMQPNYSISWRWFKSTVTHCEGVS